VFQPLFPSWHNDTETIMKWSPLYLAALTPFAFFSSGVLFGHAVVLVVTLGIFFGTLSLGRTTSAVEAPRPDRTLSS
jgi:hypothetical protein